MVAQLDSLYLKTSIRKTLIRLISYTFFEGRPLTTKGQWINPIVLSLYSLQKHLPQFKEIDRPIFIIGTGRSGTTILGTLLSMHKDVGFLNEPKALWHAIYSQEDLVGSYSRGPAKYRLSANDVTSEVREAANKLYSSYSTLTRTKRVVDKYPELVFRVPFVKELFPDAKFLFLIRNGWDTCQSIEGWSERLGRKVENEVHDWWGANNRKWQLLWEQVIMSEPTLASQIPARETLEHPLDMATLEWIMSMREGIHFMDQFPEDIHLIRYESLISNPKQCCQKILNFCELAPDPRFMNYAIQRLQPPPKRQTYRMHPLIRPHFNQTMAALGYS